jgi:hypothetical protein
MIRHGLHTRSTVAVVKPAPAEIVEAAWAEYLRVTREAEDARYDEVESWAWAQLQQRLQAVAD